MKAGLALPKDGWKANVGVETGDFLYVGPERDRLYKQGKCRVCGIPLFGKEPIERDVCGHEHCQAEAARVRPCKFKRLRNVTP